MYIYIYTYNLPCRLLPICQCPHGNSWTWANDASLPISSTSKPMIAQQLK